MDVRAERLEAGWDAYVQAHPLGTGCHQLGWRQVLEETFGHPGYYLTAIDQERRVRGVLPLIFVRNRILGRMLVSMPFVTYGGLLTDHDEARSAILQSAVKLARETKADYIELRQGSDLQADWPKKEHKVSMRLHLSGRYESLWARFPSKLRSQVRRAEKEGMCVRLGQSELLDDFYRVFSRKMRDLGTPVLSRTLFQSILRAFPEETRVCVVYLRDHAVAAAFLLGFRNMLEVPWASSDRRYDRLAPNMLLYHSILRFACEQRYEVFDFGRCTMESGTFWFKRQWGAEPVTLKWFYWLPNGGAIPQLNPGNPRFSLAIKLWQRLPIAVTRWAGPHIARCIP